MDSLKIWLRTTTVSAVRKQNEAIIVLHDTDNVHKALNTLIAANVHSAPVFNNQSDCLGLLDMFDLVTFLVHLFYKKAGIVDEDRGESALAALAKVTFTKHDLETKEVHESGIVARFMQHPIKSLINYSKQNNYHPINEKESLATLVSILSSSIRRVAVVNSEGKIVDFISQLSLIHFFNQNLLQFQPIAKLTLEDLGLAKKQVIIAKSDDRAIDAFAKLFEYKISALAIKREDGSLAGNISVKDIKAIMEDFKRLLLPVEEYINLIRRENLRATYPIITCHTTETLGNVITRLSTVGIHRLYINDADSTTLHCAGVVSLRDVLIAIESKTKN